MSKKSPAVSVIISFYKKIDYLILLLEGFKQQSFRDFEIIIADDGSPADIVQHIENLSEDIPFPIRHLWQEDKGFRKNRILNRAIVAAEAEYILFVDGDCIPHPEFVKEHYQNREESTVLTGRRVNLSEKITARLTAERIAEGWLWKNPLALFMDGIFGKSYDVEKGIYIKNSFLRDFMNRKKRGVLGCNFSASKDDLLAVNGFDERYEAPSIGEDSDIQFRMELAGCDVKSLNGIAVQYHLYHKLQPRLQVNLDLFELVKSEKLAYTPFGIKGA